MKTACRRPAGRKLAELIGQIEGCCVCAESLSHDPRPIVQLGIEARVLLIGQAPGRKVHESGIPWEDASGRLLLDWLGIDRDTFYDPSRIAMMPMGFCYPGKGKSGDLPPRPECAPLWHESVLEHLPELRLTVLIGNHAQRRYLRKQYAGTLTETVRGYRHFLPDVIPLIHPSPRNRYWITRNPWFESDLLPELKARMSAALG